MTGLKALAICLLLIVIKVYCEGFLFIAQLTSITISK